MVTCPRCKAAVEHGGLIQEVEDELLNESFLSSRIDLLNKTAREAFFYRWNTLIRFLWKWVWCSPSARGFFFFFYQYSVCSRTALLLQSMLRRLLGSSALVSVIGSNLHHLHVCRVQPELCDGLPPDLHFLLQRPSRPPLTPTDHQHYLFITSSAACVLMWNQCVSSLLQCQVIPNRFW